MNKPDFVEHFLINPIQVGVSSDEEQHIEVIYMFPPTWNQIKAFTKLQRIVAKSQKERGMEMSTRMTKEAFENIQRLQELIKGEEEEDESKKDDIKKALKKAVEEKRQGLIEEDQETSAKEDRIIDQSDNDAFMTYYSSQILPYIDEEEMDTLYKEFKAMLASAKSSKMFCLDTLKEDVFTSGAATLLSIPDFQVMLAKYLYFFTATSS